MSEYILEIICDACGEVMYFPIDSLPGGNEHCPYCEECGAELVVPDVSRGKLLQIEAKVEK